MAKYIKLDWDWLDDPKVVDFRDRYGKAALVDLVQFYVALSKVGGTFSATDRPSVLVVQQTVGKRGNALMQFVDKLASCGLVDQEAWTNLGIAGSARSIKDAEARAKLRDYAREASEAAAEARRRKAESRP